MIMSHLARCGKYFGYDKTVIFFDFKKCLIILDKFDGLM